MRFLCHWFRVFMTRNDLSQLYGVRLTKADRFNNQDTKKLQQMRKEMIN